MAQMDRGEDHAWACVERSLELARSHGWSEHALRAYVNLASAALVHRRLDLLERVCTDGLAFCEAGDIDLFASALAIRRARGLIARARFGEASAVLRACLARADLHGLEAEQARYALDTIAMRCGEWSDDAAWTALIEGRRGLKVDPWYAPQALIRVEAAWLRGEHAWVRRIGADVLPIWIARGESWRIGQMAVWLRRVGDGFDSGNLVLPPPCALEIGGDPAEAARQWAAMGCAYEQALTLACGDESCLRQALTLADQIGAHPLARIARQRLRELGVRDVARGPIRGTRADPLGLTARERTVLNLLAEGLSNRQIAGRLHRSERTVENHVAALLAKLNVETRAQAAAFAGREN
jgi:DNA-binding CsgD family transcriptional regulator